MPKNLNLNDLPVANGGQVDFTVPGSTYVLRNSGTVYAEPGDHIHGHKWPTEWAISVYDGKTCPVCKSVTAD